MSKITRLLGVRVQDDLFEIPRAPATTGGSLNFDHELRAVLSDELKRCPKDRYQVAAEMSRLLGREVSKHMLDAYTAESRDAYNFPLNYAAAFEVATDSFSLTELLAGKRGCMVLVGKDVLLAELGRLEKQKDEIKFREGVLRNRIRSREERNAQASIARRASCVICSTKKSGSAGSLTTTRSPKNSNASVKGFPTHQSTATRRSCRNESSALKLKPKSSSRSAIPWAGWCSGPGVTRSKRSAWFCACKRNNHTLLNKKNNPPEGP